MVKYIVDSDQLWTWFTYPKLKHYTDALHVFAWNVSETLGIYIESSHVGLVGYIYEAWVDNISPSNLFAFILSKHMHNLP